MTGHVLGLDLSLTETGWATVTPTGHHECGVIRTTPAMGDLAVRLDEICTQISKRAPYHDTLLVVIEKPYNATHGQEPAYVFGAAVHTLHPTPQVHVPPQSLKVFACGGAAGGKGNAKLGPALEAHKRLAYQGANDNEVDALWLAHLGWHLLGEPVVDLPQTHTRALTAPWAKSWPGHVAPQPKARKKKAAA